MELHQYIILGLNLYRIQLRAIFGTNRYRKEYDEALDVLKEDGNWFYLYDSLDGPNGEQVCVALKKWIEAYQAKKEYTRLTSDPDCQDMDKLLSNERQAKEDLHVLIYGEFTEGLHGYVSDDEDLLKIKRTTFKLKFDSLKSKFDWIHEFRVDQQSYLGFK